jgi:diguanylate cyclase (GGDEF)-like protein
MGGDGVEGEQLLSELARIGDRLAVVEGRLHDVEARLAAREWESRALVRLGDALAATHDLPAMVSAVLETTALYLGAEVGVFHKLVAGGDRLRALAAVGTNFPAEDLPGGEGVAGAAASTAKVVVWDGHDGPGPHPPEPAVARAVAIPVRPGGHLFGVLALYGLPADRPTTEGDIEILQTLVRQAEGAIENSFLYEEARHLSLTDGLTGLWNDRDFELRLAERLSEAERFGDDFSLVLADLDGFKEINDSYGHQAGNGVLVELSRRLMESTREVDRVFRLSGGGDEFALLLPRTGVAGALRLADKVRASVVGEPFRVDDTEIRVTMSLGVATHPEHGANEKVLKDAADAALYRAKHHGGNRVEHAKVGE